MLEKISNWNNIIIECNDANSIKSSSDLCQKHRARMILVPNNCVEQSMVYRGILKSHHIISTEISKIDQRQPGFEKFIGLPADVFDLNSFELQPLNTENPQILLNDLRVCSEFLVSKISQIITIGWNLSNHKLSGGGFVKLLDTMIYGYKPDYIRFNDEQEIAANTARKMLSVKIALPYGSEIESDYRLISNTQLQ